MYKSSKVIKIMFTSTGKLISIAFVSKTDRWHRTSLDQNTKDEFAKTAERYKDTLKPETVKVAMKERECSSLNDSVSHYSVLEIDKDENVVASKHYYVNGATQCEGKISRKNIPTPRKEGHIVGLGKSCISVPGLRLTWEAVSLHNKSLIQKARKLISA